MSHEKFMVQEIASGRGIKYFSNWNIRIFQCRVNEFHINKNGDFVVLCSRKHGEYPREYYTVVFEKGSGMHTETPPARTLTTARKHYNGLIDK